MPIARFRRNTSKLKALLGIRARLVILALILVVPLMLDRVRVLEDTRSKQVGQAAHELLELAKHTADAQREIVSTVQAVLKSSAYIYSAASQQGRGCAVMRASLRVDLPWIRGIAIVGPEGKIDCSTTQAAVGYYLGDRDYILKARELHEFVVSDYILSRTTGLPTLIAAYPVSAIGGGQESVVIATMDLKWISQLLTRRTERPGVSTVLIDGNGTVMASLPSDAAPVGHPLKDTSLLQAVALHEINLDRESGTLEFESADSGKKIISFADVSGTRGRVIVSIDETTMLAGIDGDIRAAYLQLCLVGLLTLLGAWLAGEHLIMRPIRMMTDMANRFGRGELSARASGASLPGEFVPLANAFDTMASQLSEREREMSAANDRLTVIASLDLVSGLANRRGFQSRLDFEWMKALHSGTRLSLIMIDVDHFKLFNDTYGHPEGDACLNRVSGVLAAIGNSHGGFAARYGGEEFCLLLPNGNSADALQVAEQVRAAVEGMAISHLTSPAGCVTVSVGVATVSPEASQSHDDLIEAADAALYAAKRRGRNAVVEHGLTPPAAQPASLAS